MYLNFESPLQDATHCRHLHNPSSQRADAEQQAVAAHV